MENCSFYTPGSRNALEKEVLSCFVFPKLSGCPQFLADPEKMNCVEGTREF